MHCRPRKHCKVLPAIVHPTKCNVVQQTCEYIVPEIHPTHTTQVTNHVYNHVHSFPHTVSQQQQVYNQQFYQPPGPPTPVAGAMAGPGPVAGAAFGKGKGKCGC
ncbi:spore coat protein [Halalkalibacterium halodurans]|uniref:spore coat protein n=1 Tax=Halalkalibacterium halodurans TaxID=86665 RepID=UPI002E1AC262|nr:spore coat protein [Halalkalibacterium halodurans]